jgi:hypothetical protein
MAGLLVIGAVSLVDGVVEGLVAGVTKAEIKKNEKAMRQALEENPLQPGIQTCLGQVAAKRSFERLVQVPDPTLADLKSQTATNRDYRALSGLGFDSALEIRISEQGFIPAGRLNRSMMFVAEAEVFVIRISDGAILHAGCLNYQSCERTFTEWGANHARNVRMELKQAQQIFADSVLEQLFALDPEKR